MPNGQVIQHPHWPPGVGPNRPVHPGPAPIHPPWQGGMWTGCDCGCDPCVCQPCTPQWSQDAIRCWNEMQQFRQMVQDIVQGELAKGDMAITGVTDGSNAKPGDVGEYISGSAQISFAAYPTTTNTTVSPLILPPGDWNVWGHMTTSTGVGPSSVGLSLIPPGMSHSMYVGMGVWTGAPETVNLTMPTARGSFSVPTLLPFGVVVHQEIASTLTAGVFTLLIEARRVR